MLAAMGSACVGFELHGHALPTAALASRSLPSFPGLGHSDLQEAKREKCPHHSFAHDEVIWVIWVLRGGQAIVRHFSSII